MTSVQLKDLKGNAVGEVNFEDSVFGIEPNKHVLHAALHRQLTNARSGTASAKTRAEVSGGGRKPWRQKGTGRARAGSTRSPLWAGGGVIFGPKPRDYSQSLPKKVRQLALRSALAARRDQFVVVKSFDGLFKNPPPATKEDATSKTEQPKTKQFNTVLKDLGIADKCLLLILDDSVPGCLQIERAARNLTNVCVVHANNINVKQLIECQSVLISERTVAVLNNRFQGHAAATKGGASRPQKVAREHAEKAHTQKPAQTEKPKSTKPEKAATPMPPSEPAKAKTPKAAAPAEPQKANKDAGKENKSSGKTSNK